MKHVVVIFACLALLMSCGKQEQKVPAVEPAAETKPLPTEIADSRYIDMGKKDFAALNAMNIDAYMNSFSDNAKYFFSGGDSLIGKSNIASFWKNRFATVVDSVTFFNDIWTPIKVNVSQQGNLPGIWLLSWYQVAVKYKNGQKLTYAVHTDLHYDSSDKIDVAILYMDRAPINAALAKK